MRIKLNASGIILYFDVSYYSKTTKDTWDEEWCRTDGAIVSRFMNYRLGNKILMSQEVDALVDLFTRQVNGEMQQKEKFSCVEPDLTFICYPVTDLRTTQNMHMCDRAGNCRI
jgi:hypothetical protein